MLRRFELSVVIILLLSSGAFAFIGQVEGFSIEANNLVGRSGGVGSAEGGNILMAYHEQGGYDACRDTIAIQKEGGVLGQAATAVGVCGITGVGQEAKIGGLQGQLATNPQMQGQVLGVSLGQTAYKDGGVGGAEGVQGFIGGQSQIISSPTGTSTESQFVGVVQYSAVGGGPHSDAVASNKVDITMAQGQIKTGHRRW
ncbi:MAG: hypothetical protein ACYS9C_06680 [Planctomycetota bacterium]|jgi:hypothetical protein